MNSVKRNHGKSQENIALAIMKIEDTFPGVIGKKSVESNPSFKNTINCIIHLFKKFFELLEYE